MDQINVKSWFNWPSCIFRFYSQKHVKSNLKMFCRFSENSASLPVIPVGLSLKILCNVLKLLLNVFFLKAKKIQFTGEMYKILAKEKSVLIFEDVWDDFNQAEWKATQVVKYFVFLQKSDK